MGEVYLNGPLAHEQGSLQRLSLGWGKKLTTWMRPKEREGEGALPGWVYWMPQGGNFFFF